MIHDLPLIAATPSGDAFARKVAAYLAVKYLPERMSRSGINKSFDTEQLWVPSSFMRFADGDSKVHIGRSIRDSNIYVIADPESHAITIPADVSDRRRAHTITITHDTTLVQAKERRLDTILAKDGYDRNYADFIRLISTIRSVGGPRASITGVLPIHVSNRQDRRSGRYSLDLRDRVRQFESATGNHMLTIDIHNEATELAYGVATGFDHLYAAHTFLKEMRNNPLPGIDYGNIHVVSPDAGAFERNLTYAQELGATVGFLYKRRSTDKPNEIDTGTEAYAGDLNDFIGKDCFLVDDQIDTGGTNIRAARFAMKQGAKSVTAIATHAVFSDNATGRLNDAVQEGYLKYVLTTNSINHPQETIEANPWWHVIDITQYFAKAIDRHNFGESLSELLRETG